MRRAAAGCGLLLAALAVLAGRAEFTPVGAIADTRLPGLLSGLAALALLFGPRVADLRARGARALGPVAIAGGLAALAASVFCLWLLLLTYRETEVRFESGGVVLAGTIHAPRSAGPHPGIVFIHGAGREARAEFRWHAKLFARHGFAALAYDKRGAGASGGDTYAATYEDYAGDAAAAAVFLQERGDAIPDRIGFLGQSEGGWVAPIAAGRFPAAFVIVTSSTPLSPAEQELYETGADLVHAGYDGETVARAVSLRRRLFEYHRTGAGREALQADLDGARAEPWFGAAALEPEVGPPEDYGWWRSVMDFDARPHWERVMCPVLAISGGLDRKSDARASQAGIGEALARGGNRRYTARIFPRMEHGAIEWWLPWRLPPPRFPAGFPALLVGWAREQAGIGAAERP